MLRGNVAEDSSEEIQKKTSSKKESSKKAEGVQKKTSSYGGADLRRDTRYQYVKCVQ